MSTGFLAAAPGIFKLVPLLFIAVALFLIYFTLSLFLNTSWIDIEDGLLTITHKPIPVWQGNRAIEVSQIDQIFVKEKIHRHQDGVSKTYVIYALLKDGSEIKLFGNNEIDSQKALFLERKLEDYIGIQDRKMEGSLNPKSQPKPLRVANKIASHFHPVSYLDHGDSLLYQQEKFDIVFKAQFDRMDSQTDLQIQAVKRDGEELSLYMQQERGLQRFYNEKELNLLITNNFDFSAENPPETIQFQGQEFMLHKRYEGFLFSENHAGDGVIQWLYLNEQRKEYIRIIEKGWVKTYWAGQEFDQEDIHVKDAFLKLKRIEKLRRTYDQDDLV